jgi:hypothetical protein
MLFVKKETFFMIETYKANFFLLFVCINEKSSTFALIIHKKRSK